MTQTPEFNSYEQALIEQLRNSPDPQIDPVVADYLRQRIFAEVDEVWQSPDTAPDTLSVGLRSQVFLLVAGAIVLLIIVVMIVVGRSPEIFSESVVPTATVTETHTPNPTATPTATPTYRPTEAQTPTATASPSPTATPSLVLTATPEDDLISIIIIEGMVIEVNDGIIVVFDVVIELDGITDPIPPITPGVIVRVEGLPRIEGGRLIVRATRITVIVQAPTPSTRPGQAPPPPGGGRSSRSSRSS